MPLHSRSVSALDSSLKREEGDKALPYAITRKVEALLSAVKWQHVNRDIHSEHARASAA